MPLLAAYMALCAAKYNQEKPTWAATHREIAEIIHLAGKHSIPSGRIGESAAPR
jgi:hypothetical protein